MQRANFVMSVRICWTTAGEGGTPGPPYGSRYPQAWVAAWKRGLPAASSTRLFGHTPLLSGSGKFDTPRERMQWEKASGWEVADRELGETAVLGAVDVAAGWVVVEPSCAT
jgi:hypothetical protein